MGFIKLGYYYSSVIVYLLGKVFELYSFIRQSEYELWKCSYKYFDIGMNKWIISQVLDKFKKDDTKFL